MKMSRLLRSLFLLSFLVLPSFAALVQQQPLVLTYHKGPLLKGRITINLVWYGKFSPVQRSIIVDFIQSLSSLRTPLPSAASWWRTTEKYAGGGATTIVVGRQFVHEAYTLGKSLKDFHLLALAHRAATGDANSITVVLTASDVAVNGFGMSRCATHGAIAGKLRYAYLWVGNPEKQCPGLCAWPFYKPIYGPQTAPLVPPNGDVGVDGMIINLATVLAGAVTNPFQNGYFQGPAPMYEAVSACAGIFGSGAYAGYPGQVAVDKTTGASYNVHGVNGRKFLLPAMWDPTTSACSPPK